MVYRLYVVMLLGAQHDRVLRGLNLGEEDTLLSLAGYSRRLSLSLLAQWKTLQITIISCAGSGSITPWVSCLQAGSAPCLNYHTLPHQHRLLVPPAAPPVPAAAHSPALPAAAAPPAAAVGCLTLVGLQRPHPAAP
jgi:hypothetical protein